MATDRKYVVLEHVSLGAGEYATEAWVERGEFDGASSDAAIKAYLEADPQKEAVTDARTFVAPPSRNWNPATIRRQTVTTITVEHAKPPQTRKSAQPVTTGS